MNKISLTRQNLEDFTNNDIGFYGLKLSRISSIFITQVLQMQSRKVINTHQMLDEVKFLEGIKSASSTQAATSFKKNPLNINAKKVTDLF